MGATLLDRHPLHFSTAVYSPRLCLHDCFGDNSQAEARIGMMLVAAVGRNAQNFSRCFGDQRLIICMQNVWISMPHQSGCLNFIAKRVPQRII